MSFEKVFLTETIVEAWTRKQYSICHELTSGLLILLNIHLKFVIVNISNPQSFYIKLPAHAEMECAAFTVNRAARIVRFCFTLKCAAHQTILKKISAFDLIIALSYITKSISYICEPPWTTRQTTLKYLLTYMISDILYYRI